jgi:hypothetical protein
MKDVVLYEGNPTEFISYFIYYEFLNFWNELVQQQASSGWLHRTWLCREELSCPSTDHSKVAGNHVE